VPIEALVTAVQVKITLFGKFLKGTCRFAGFVRLKLVTCRFPQVHLQYLSLCHPLMRHIANYIRHLFFLVPHLTITEGIEKFSAKENFRKIFKDSHFYLGFLWKEIHNKIKHSHRVLSEF